jgi:hypothetical protein
VVEGVQDGKGKGLESRLRLVVRALVSAHYYRPRLNRVLEAEGNDSEAKPTILRFTQVFYSCYEITKRKSQCLPPE